MYDFKTMVDRSSMGSIKWNNKKYDGIPFSTADTDFKLAPEIREGLVSAMEHNVLGYTQPTDEYYNALIRWFEERHDVLFKREWIFDSPGVLDAVAFSIETFTQPQDSVMIMEPVYHPFRKIIERMGRNVSSNQLINNKGHFEMDFEMIEQKIIEDKVSLLILCSPHNPVGRVWTIEELVKLADICSRHDIIVLFDEIHADVISPHHTHTVFSNVYGKAIITNSASKSFNLSGLQTAAIIISDNEMNQQFKAYLDSRGLHTLNAIGPVATTIAYNEAGAWLDAFNEHIHENHIFLLEYFNNHLPQLIVTPLEGTYLQWLDFTALFDSQEEFDTFLETYLQMNFDPGIIFGSESGMFQRMNIAVSRAVLEEACLKIVDVYHRFNQIK